VRSASGRMILSSLTHRTFCIPTQISKEPTDKISRKFRLSQGLTLPSNSWVTWHCRSPICLPIDKEWETRCFNEPEAPLRLSEVSDYILPILPEMIGRVRAMGTRNSRSQRVMIAVGVDGTAESVALAHALHTVIAGSELSASAQVVAFVLTSRDYSSLDATHASKIHESLEGKQKDESDKFKALDESLWSQTLSEYAYNQTMLDRDIEWSEILAATLKKSGVVTLFSGRDPVVSSLAGPAIIAEALSKGSNIVALPMCKEAYLSELLNSIVVPPSRSENLAYDTYCDAGKLAPEITGSLPENMINVLWPLREVSRGKCVSYCNRLKLPFRFHSGPSTPKERRRIAGISEALRNEQVNSETFLQDWIRATQMVRSVASEIEELMFMVVENTVVCVDDFGTLIFDRKGISSREQLGVPLSILRESFLKLFRLISPKFEDSGSELLQSMYSRFVDGITLQNDQPRGILTRTGFGCVISATTGFKLVNWINFARPSSAQGMYLNKLRGRYIEESEYEKQIGIKYGLVHIAPNTGFPVEVLYYPRLMHVGQLMYFAASTVIGIEEAPTRKGDTVFRASDVLRCAFESALFDESHCLPEPMYRYPQFPQAARDIPSKQRFDNESQSLKDLPKMTTIANLGPPLKIGDATISHPIFRVRRMVRTDIPIIYPMFRKSQSTLERMDEHMRSTLLVIERGLSAEEFQQKVETYETFLREKVTDKTLVKKQWAEFVEFSTTKHSHSGEALVGHPRHYELAAIPQLGLNFYNKLHPDKKPLNFHTWYLPVNRRALTPGMVPAYNPDAHLNRDRHEEEYGGKT